MMNTQTHDKRWYESCGPQADVVVSSRIRLARNLKDSPFPNRLDAAAQRGLNERIREAFFNSSAAMRALYLDVDLEKLSPIEQELLAEKRLISPALLQAPHPVEAIIRKDEALSIMLGEEDHIRIQAMRAGLALDEAYQDALQLALLLEERLPLAFDEQWGFLTTCPTNTGTGLRASVMLHLPALTELGQIKNLAQQLSRLGMTVRGAMGEGTKGNGCLYQVSNQITLGLSEEDLIADLKKAAAQTVTLEKNARRELLTHKRLLLEDRLFRSKGILENARCLSQEEAEQRLSDLRWGVALDFFPELALDDVAPLLCRCGRAQVQRLAGGSLTPEERDERRAQDIRGLLQKAQRSGSSSTELSPPAERQAKIKNNEHPQDEN